MVDIAAADQLGIAGLVDELNDTPLHFAMRWSKIENAARLIRSGSDVNAKNYKGRTPFHVAARKDVELACMMLYYGADETLIDHDGFSPFLYALGSGLHQIANLLYFAYDGLHGDQCHVSFFMLLRVPQLYEVDTPLAVSVLDVFKTFMQNNKVHFAGYPCSYLNSGWGKNWTEARLSRYINAFNFLLDIDLEKNIENFCLMDYVHFDDLFYQKAANVYSDARVYETDSLKFIWASLSMGISSRLSLISNFISSFGYGRQFYALIWGSLYSDFLDEPILPSYETDLFLKYLKALHCDLESCDSQNQLFDMFYSLEEHKLFKMLSFFTIPGLEFKYRANISTLVEICRNKVRTMLMDEHKTKNFYELYEVINNLLYVPYKVKKVLQLRTPVNCRNCNSTLCECDTDEVAMSLNPFYANRHDPDFKFKRIF